jgi:hypothetical protein
VRAKIRGTDISNSDEIVVYRAIVKVIFYCGGEKQSKNRESDEILLSARHDPGVEGCSMRRFNFMHFRAWSNSGPKLGVKLSNGEKKITTNQARLTHLK